MTKETEIKTDVEREANAAPDKTTNRSTVLAMGAINVLNHASFRGSKVLVALTTAQLGYSPLAIGIIFSLYSVFPLFLALFAGRMTDRYGAVLPMRLGTAGVLIGLLIPFGAFGLYGFCISCALCGGSYIFFSISMQNLIGRAGKAESRTQRYGTYSLLIGVASLTGPLITGLAVDHLGNRAAYGVLAIFPLLTLLIMSRISSTISAAHGPSSKHERMRTMDLIKDRSLLSVLIAGIVIETGLELFTFYMPIYGHSLGFSGTQVGVVAAAYALAAIVIRLGMPTLVRWGNEELVISRSLALAALFYFLTPLVHTYYLMIATSFALGLALGCCNPLAMMLAYTRSPPGNSGQALGVRQSFNKTTQVLVPIVFGSVGTALGLAAVFWSTAGLLAAASFFIRAKAKQRSKDHA
ncbi:MAG: MFS transporter [Burkholderiales bacterium]